MNWFLCKRYRKIEILTHQALSRIERFPRANALARTDSVWRFERKLEQPIDVYNNSPSRDLYIQIPFLNEKNKQSNMWKWNHLFLKSTSDIMNMFGCDRTMPGGKKTSRGGRDRESSDRDPLIQQTTKLNRDESIAAHVKGGGTVTLEDYRSTAIISKSRNYPHILPK